MFLLFWASLIFSVRSISYSAGASALGEPNCVRQFCIYVSTENITSEVGLCAVIPCSFSTPSDFETRHLVWFKCESNPKCSNSDIIFNSTNNIDKSIKDEFKGRVSLDPEVGNCSIRISDLRKSDSGSYQLRIIGLNQGDPDGFTFIPKTPIKVGGFRQKPTMTPPDLTEGHQTTLTCSAPALCSTSPPGISWMWGEAAEKDPLINGSITAFKNETLTAVTQRHNSTLTFIPTAELHNSNITCRIRFSDNTTTEETVNLHVNYKRKPQISGKVIVKEGEVLNLTCSVDSFPPVPAVWTEPQSNLLNGSDHNGSATFIITNVTAEDSGRYSCAANHQNCTETVHVDVTVMLEESACVRRSDVLTCTCISQGFPVANIKWPQLSLHSEYWITTNVSNQTVRSSLTLRATKQDNVSAECVISNESGESTEKLTIQDILSEKEDQSESPLEIATTPEAIIAFLIGVLVSAIFCILIMSCYRKKLKKNENLQEVVEKVGGQENPLNIHDEPRSGSGDVEYADIDFSRLKRKERTQELQTAATEYAEVKVKKEEKHAAEEEEPGMEEDDKTLFCVSKQRNIEEEAVYSSVNDLIGQN
uniref:B-cell receptor CD22 n=1 Tax=Oryzias melastigma TaxID=30732 RepID=A0A3B3CNT5_ORYME